MTPRTAASLPDDHEIAQLLRNLIADVAVLSERHRRARWEQILQGLVLAGLVIVGLLYWQNTLDRRTYINNRIQAVACAEVAPYRDTIPYVKAFRATYKCPPYDPSIAKLLKPTHG